VSSDIRRRTYVTRRAALASLVWLVAGCASPSRGSLTTLQAARVTLLEPAYDRDLKLEISPWAALESGATWERIRGEVSSGLGLWHDVVITGFSDTFISTLEGGGIRVDRSTVSAISADKSLSFPLVRSFLRAGFVTKTLTSSSYAPFVSVILQLWGPNGPVYRQLYVATDRQFNMFMTTLPAATPFLLADISDLRRDPAPAVNALRSLAQQLGQKFALDLLA